LYCAVWLQPEESRVNQRVVIVRPIKDKPPWVKKPEAAWQILRSAIHEERTGCIIAGTEETLPQCLAAIEKDDQHWPNDTDRMVAAITALAEKHGCTVIFRQNLKPGAVEPAPGASVGACTLEAGSPVWTVVGPAEAITATLQKNEHLKELSRIGSTRVKVGLLDHAEAAAPLKDQVDNAGGMSFSQRLSFEQAESLLDVLLQPKAKKFKFALLVRQQTHCVIFMGTKGAVTNIRQAISSYVEHLRGSEDPKEAAETDESFENSPDVPKTGNCRFWRLHR
jgi:hypothetical protein